eukprot:GHVU01181717.1.p1 GENE.GHVU01181717.1~~GHVU01181717.1.p1  ORF type:complete len:101 (-),score=0.35 GHVU01181717.1:253-555(-)
MPHTCLGVILTNGDITINASVSQLINCIHDDWLTVFCIGASRDRDDGREIDTVVITIVYTLLLLLLALPFKYVRMNVTTQLWNRSGVVVSTTTGRQVQVG